MGLAYFYRAIANHDRLDIVDRQHRSSIKDIADIWDSVPYNIVGQIKLMYGGL